MTPRTVTIPPFALGREALFEAAYRDSAMRAAINLLENGETEWALKTLRDAINFELDQDND